MLAAVAEQLEHRKSSDLQDQEQAANGKDLPARKGSGIWTGRFYDFFRRQMDGIWDLILSVAQNARRHMTTFLSGSRLAAADKSYTIEMEFTRCRWATCGHYSDLDAAVACEMCHACKGEERKRITRNQGSIRPAESFTVPVSKM
jgi:hypothetical protein